MRTRKITAIDVEPGDELKLNSGMWEIKIYCARANDPEGSDYIIINPNPFYSKNLNLHWSKNGKKLYGTETRVTGIEINPGCSCDENGCCDVCVTDN